MTKGYTKPVTFKQAKGRNEKVDNLKYLLLIIKKILEMIEQKSAKGYINEAPKSFVFSALF
jgi:hypothetical protein